MVYCAVGSSPQSQSGQTSAKHAGIEAPHTGPEVVRSIPSWVALR